MNKFKNKGFTIVELIVVIAIIAILATIIITSVNQFQAKARDAKRIADMSQVMKALEIYRSENSQYPDTDNDDCGGWDVGNRDYLFLNGRLPNIMPTPPRDPTATGNCSGYFYYRYPAGYANCDASKGAFYVLAISNLETVNGASPTSPGWRCPDRNWQNEFEWVTGKFEK